jgi:predicted DNA-binding transcriptional regulator YafY
MNATDKTSSGPELTSHRVVIFGRLLRALQDGTHTFEALRGIVSPQVPVSIRTMRRYLSHLERAGFAYKFDTATKTYRLRADGARTATPIGPEDAGTLLALRACAEHVGPAALNLLNRITNAGGTAQAPLTHIVKLPPVTLDLDNETFVDLQHAVRERRTVAFNYENNSGQRSHRQIDPYGLLSSNGRSYVVGLDQKSGEVRTFAVDQVTSLCLTAKVFAKPTSFKLEEWNAGVIGGVLAATDDLQVTVRFARILRGAVLRAGGPERLRTSDASDGALDVVYRVRHVDEFARWIMSWGAAFEIVAPARVRHTVATLASAIAARHAPQPLAIAS